MTHMSHIETGTTKLSLPVLVEISKALDEQTDNILFDKPRNSDVAVKELQLLFDDCSAEKMQIITEVAKATKDALNKHI